MHTDISIWQLIVDASLLVQVVMLLLLVASVISWMLVFQKASQIRITTKLSNEFEEQFWSGVNVQKLYQQSKDDDQLLGVQKIFAAGFREFSKLHQNQKVNRSILLDSAARSMRVTLNRELDRLENKLGFLATVGSTSPYVGLFGTVWGIMNSFIALGGVSQATIAMVAPGIAEALIATAMGLFAAIPAVISYNRFTNQIERLHVRFDAFQEEFLSILQRQLHMQADN